MDNAIYQDWWQLHLRTARGDILTSHEKAVYEGGLADLECGEQLPAAVDARELRQSLAMRQKEHLALEQKRRELDAEINELESRLSQDARRYLGVED